MAYRVFPEPRPRPDQGPRAFGRRDDVDRLRRERRSRRIKRIEIAALVVGSTVLAAFAAGAL